MRPVLAPYLLTLAVAALLGRPAAAADAPGLWLKEKVRQAESLAKQSFEAGSKQEAAWKEDVQTLIDSMLNWSELTRRALGSQWKKRSARERQTFARRLREMVEASYESKLRLATAEPKKKPKDVKITWRPETVSGDTAELFADVRVDKKEALLGFKLQRSKGQWRVYDVLIDEVSTVRTYRSQFRKIIKQEGFPALLARMERKIGEIRSGTNSVMPN